MQALAYLHEQGIVHRDVKGENVVLSQQVARGRAKLVDFGTARRLEPGATLSGLCGSPEYVAPEVAGARPYGRECDLWSAGVLAFAMLTRSYPFGMGDAAIARSAAFTAGAVELNEHAKWAGVSEMAQDLVRRLLVADPARRLGGRGAPPPVAGAAPGGEAAGAAGCSAQRNGIATSVSPPRLRSSASRSTRGSV